MKYNKLIKIKLIFIFLVLLWMLTLYILFGILNYTQIAMVIAILGFIVIPIVGLGIHGTEVKNFYDKKKK
jgi:hypothetical protein